MDVINQKLRYLYLNPDKTGFNLVVILVQNKLSIFIALSIILLSYPIIQLTKDHFTMLETTEAIHGQSALLEHKQKTYNLLIEKEKKFNEQDLNLASINELLQETAQKYQIQIDHLQWNLEQGKSLELRVIHTSQAIFKFISDLNQIPYLKFNQLALTKLEQERKLELHCILVITTQ